MIKFSQLPALQVVTSTLRPMKSKCKRNRQWFFHLRLGLQNDLFISCLLAKTLYAFPLCPVLVTSPVHLILLDLVIVIFGEKRKF